MLFDDDVFDDVLKILSNQNFHSVKFIQIVLFKIHILTLA